MVPAKYCNTKGEEILLRVMLTFWMFFQMHISQFCCVFKFELSTQSLVNDRLYEYNNECIYTVWIVKLWHLQGPETYFLSYAHKIMCAHTLCLLREIKVTSAAK